MHGEPDPKTTTVMTVTLSVAPRLGYPAKVRGVEDEETPFPAPEDRRMSYGVYKGKMFTEIARDHPEYEELLEAAYKNKSENSVPQYVKQYLAWLTDHKKTKQLPAKTRTKGLPPKAPRPMCRWMQEVHKPRNQSALGMSDLPRLRTW